VLSMPAASSSALIRKPIVRSMTFAIRKVTTNE
jgi:hypothetical protein